MEQPERRARMHAEFQRRYGSAPTVWTRAPGRVDLMGSHTDYNLGRVMTMTIDRDTWLAARPRPDRRVTVQSLNAPGVSAFSLDHIDHDGATPWADYVRGTAWAMQEAGHTLSGFDGLIHSTVPFGSGLSSSAALEMATAALFKTLGELALTPVEMALLGQQAENRFVGVNSGILDQYTSAVGRAGTTLLLDCRDLSSRAVTLPAVWQVVICDTRAERSLTGSEYGERRAQCEAGVAVLQRHDPAVRALRDVSLEQLEAHRDELSDVVLRRCRFIIQEDQRVLDLAGALETGDGDGVRRLMAASYAGARDLYEISAPAMEAMIDAMTSAPGVIGARQAGAGFGGCMVAIVAREATPDFAAAVAARYRAHTGIDAVIYPVNASDGAGLSAM